MTPQYKEHIQRLLTAMEAAKKDVEQWRSDMGLVSADLSTRRTKRPELTGEHLRALEKAELKLMALEDEYYAALGAEAMSNRKTEWVEAMALYYRLWTSEDDSTGHRPALFKTLEEIPPLLKTVAFCPHSCTVFP